MRRTQIRKLVKILLLAGMICFFLPFVTVSCSSESVTATGFELMTNIATHEGIQFDDSDVVNIYLIIAFIAGIVGIAIQYTKLKKKTIDTVSGSCGAGALLCLILFRVTLLSYYGISSDPDYQRYSSYVTIDYRYGLMLSMIANLIASGLSFALARGIIQGVNPDVLKSLAQQDVPETPPDDAADNKTEDTGPIRPTDIPVNRNREIEKPQLTKPLDEGANNEESRVKVVFRMGTNENASRVRIESYPCLIGRDPNACNLVIDNKSVSRVHAVVYVGGNDVLIEDMDSKNGTKINGETITKPEEILSGDIIELGSVKLVAEVQGE